MTERKRACLCGATDCKKHARSGWARNPPASSPFTYRGDWPHRVRMVLERDGYICQLRYDCCVGRASEVDHIIRPADGGTNDLANLRAVCRPCHARRSGRQGALAKQRKNPR